MIPLTKQSGYIENLEYSLDCIAQELATLNAKVNPHYRQEIAGLESKVAMLNRVVMKLIYEVDDNGTR